MSRDLVNPIAYGRTSEIYFWDEEHVLKLFYDWISVESIENEVRISHAVFESGLPVPEVGEIVHVKERIGLVYQRIHGDSMYTVVKRKPWHLPYIYKRSAELHVEIKLIAFQLNSHHNDKFWKKASIKQRRFPVICVQRC